VTFLLVSGAIALAQSVTNSALRGRVTSEGQALGSVAVGLTSPVLQGARTAYTSANGDYVFVGMPPGDYTVTFTLQGMQTVTKTVALTAAQEATLDATMTVAASRRRRPSRPRPRRSPPACRLDHDHGHEKLPVARTVGGRRRVLGVAQVTVWATRSRFPAGHVRQPFHGGRRRHHRQRPRHPNNLFIEDAIQETTTTVSSVSAEYGRFTGGVVNTITKSGGNLFSGSFRTTLTNDAWSAVSPAKETRVQEVSPRYEATLGGFLWKDHLWFFGSGRFQDTSVASQTSAPTGVSPIPFRSATRRGTGAS
jgi:hypothetical protein